MEETEKQIVHQILINPKTRISDLTKTLKIPRRTIEDSIVRLKNKRVLKRIGSNKTGNWEIIKK